MTDTPKVPSRLRAIFALSKLAPSLQSDLLADGTVQERWRIPVRQSMVIGKDVSVNRTSLFSILRACVDGRPIPPLRDDAGKGLAATAKLNGNGSVVIDMAGPQMTFMHAVLLSSSPARRLQALNQIFSTITLAGKEQDRLREIVGRNNYSDSDFVAVARSLSSSLEEFEGRLKAKLNVRQVSRVDILPDEAQHWDNLTAPLSGSQTLAQFIDGELLDERRARLSVSASSALRAISLTFAAPNLVPHSLIETIDTDKVIKALEQICQFEDHFSLVGAFEICTRLLGRGQQYVELGDRILDRLFSDMSRLQTACGMFGSAFVIATASLASDEKLQKLPAFWRRLAAASQASLVVRTSGVTPIDPDKLFEWAVGQAGESYFLSIAADFPTDPQWLPEWIVQRFLVADTIGRAWGALEFIPSDAQPESWQRRIQTARQWAKTNEVDMLLGLPAVAEGARRPRIPISDLFPPLQEAYRRLEADPSLENLLILTPAIYAYGFPIEIQKSLHEAIGVLRRNPDTPEEAAQAVLTLNAHVSAIINDVKLADGVAEICIEQIANAKDRSTVVQCVFRIVECAGADPDQAAAQTTLVRRLEQAAFLVPAGPLAADLLDLLEVLKSVHWPLRQRLGRALVMARLGASRANAA